MMKTYTLAALVITGLLTAFAGAVLADRDRDEYSSDYRESSERSDHYRSSGYRGGSGVAAVNNTLYADECGSCHFAYQPGLLPERSWRDMMAKLDDHFGENAEVDDVDRQALTEYLATNAADHSNYKRSVKFMRTIATNETPERITDVGYFKRKHREVPRRVLDKVSLSNCQQCHTKAERGSYTEREIDIPGYGRWED